MPVIRTIFFLIFAFSSIFYAQSVNKETLSPLPYSKIEVGNIRNIIGGELLLDDDATLSNTLNALEKYDIVHIATHTTVNERLPLSSKFVLFGNNDSSGNLFLSRIYSLKMKAKMVVLSSCNTGRGKLEKGEGIISFARAFKSAGCSSVIMSLWEIDDISTSKIMNDFYTELQTGKPKDAALREAKINYLKNSNSKTAAPVFWAGASAIGDMNPLTFKTGYRFSYLNYAAPITVAFALILYLIFRKRKRGATL